MANGTSGIVDISAMDAALKKISREFTNLVNTGKSVEQALVQNFKNISKNGIAPLISDLTKITSDLSKVGSSGGGSTMMKNINTDTTQAIDKTNKFLELMAKINNNNAGQRSNSAIAKVTADIDAAKRELGVIQVKKDALSHGLEKGRHKDVKAYEGLQKEEKIIKNYIDSLEREKSSLQANQRLRLQLAAQRDKPANDWAAMEKAKQQEVANAEKAALDRRERIQREWNERRRQQYERLFEDQIKHNNAMTMPTVSQTVFGNNQQVASVSTMSASVQQMRQAQEQLNMKTAEGRKRYRELEKEIRRAEVAIAASTGKLGEFIKGTQRSTKTMSELKGMIGMAFSVQTIWNFIKNVAKVTGQMELQHKALQAIVQDKYKADEIWSQTMQNALKSPFSISQILEHTKKLAAYRIESDKLVETTRMLGDISAGVGVDMNRLVLAYGQVRAATYLRASELRQFTEANIPLLDELANYFTKLEGKVVTTGEVFSRISDKAVTFKDVETVIKRMTDEGGVFFNMQEMQSETLAGKIAKLKDSYTLMLNEIGTANNSTLVKAVDAMQNLMNNWERFAPIIQGILVGIMAKGIASVIVNIGTLIGRIAVAETVAAKLGQTLFTLSKMSMGGWLAIIGAVVALGTAIYNATTATDALTAKLGKIDSEVEKDLNDSKEMFEELADAVRSSTNTYSEREEALDKLQRKYKDILPDYMLELEYLMKMKQGYEEANASMELFYANEARKKKEKLINEEYDTDIQSKIGEVDEDAYYSIGYSGRDSRISEVKFNGEDNVQLIEKTIAELESGKIKAEEFGNELNKAFRKFYNLPENVHLANKKFLDVIDKVTEKYKKLENVKVGFYDTPEEKQNIIDFKANTDEFEKTKKRITNLRSELEKYYDMLKNPPTMETVGLNDTEEDVKAKEQEYQAKMQQHTQDLEARKKDIMDLLTNGQIVDGQIVQKGAGLISQQAEDFLSNATKSSTELYEQMDALGIKMLDSFEKGVQGGDEVKAKIHDLAESSREELRPEEWQTMFAQIQEGVFQQHGLTMGQIDEANVFAFNSLDEYVDELQKIYDELQGKKVQIDIAKSTWTKLGWLGKIFNTVAKYLKFLGLGKFENLDAQLKALENLISAAGRIPKESSETKSYNSYNKSNNRSKPKHKKEQKKAADTTSERFKDAESFIEDVYDTYYDLLQTRSAEDAKKAVMQIFKDDEKVYFSKELKGLSLSKFQFDETSKSVVGLTTSLEQLSKTASNIKYKGYDNFTRDLKTKVNKIKSEAETARDLLDLEDVVENVEIDFSKYDLFRSLEEMGVSKDFAKQFFGIDAFSLDEINANLNSLLDSGAFAGTEGYKKYQEFMERLREKEQQEREQDLQHYIETSQEALTEAARIKMQLAVEQQKILNAFSVEDGVEETESQKQRREQMKQQALEGAQKKASDKLRKIEWEEFMNTDTFQKLMGDLENTSIAGLRHMKEKLLEYKEAWKDTPELFDDVIKKLQDVEDAMTEAQIKANPFKAYREAKNISKLRNGRTDEQIDRENEELEKENSKYNSEISGLQSFLTTATDAEQVTSIKSLIKAEKDLIEKNEEQIKQNNAIKKSAKDQIKALDGQKEVYEKIQSSVADFGGALSELWEVFGDGDDVTGKSIGFGFDMADQVTQIITMVITTKQLKLALDNAGQGAEAFGAKLNMALGIIGWITMAISLVAKVWSFANEIHDDKINKEIEEYKKNIEALEKSYEALEKAIESAYDSASLNENFDEANRNLEQRIAYEEAILEAEQSKKKKDQDAIDEAKESIEELREEQKQLLKDTAEDLGAIYDVRDAAKDFVDAWLEAFQETGNGLKGLKENFKETFKDIMLQQAVMSGAGQIMKPLFDEINTALENDFVVDDTEYKNINKIADDQLGALDSFLTSFYEKYPDVFEAASELSGLQAGIEGITEQQAEVISAYLNSIRFFVHSIDENTKRLAEQGLTSTDMANKLALANNEAALSGSKQDENPMLSQLQMLVEQTKAINDLLGSVTRHGHTKGGYGLKVFID